MAEEDHALDSIAGVPNGMWREYLRNTRTSLESYLYANLLGDNALDDIGLMYCYTSVLLLINFQQILYKRAGDRQNIFIVKKGNELIWSNMYPNAQLEGAFERTVNSSTNVNVKWKKFLRLEYFSRNKDQNYRMGQLMLCVLKFYFKNDNF
jgi:hypothetical protein